MRASNRSLQASRGLATTSVNPGVDVRPNPFAEPRSSASTSEPRPAASLFLSWEQHRRTRELGRSLNAPVVEMLSSRKGMWRYPGLLARTVGELVRTRPSHVLVQCPSIVLALIAALLRRVLGYRLVLDLHNEAVEPFINHSRAYRRVLAFLHRSADLSLVTNEPLCELVRANGGRPFVLPDRVPEMDPGGSHERGSASRDVVFVCTFAPDEPYEEVIAAAGLLGQDVTLHVTGRVPASLDRTGLPSNVRLTGFIPEAEYEALLRSAAVIIDLTAMENCLVCGAYEAVALGKALVTSDSRALRAYFRSGALFTRHERGAIAAAVREALDGRKDLERAIKALEPKLKNDWNNRRAALMRWLEGGYGQ